MTDTDAASRYMERTTKQYKNALTVGIIAMVLGLYGVYRVLGTSYLGNLTTEVPWGLWVGLYEYFVLLEVGAVLSFILLRYGAGIKELSSLGPIIMLTALAALVGALVAIFHDLGQPLRIWRTFLTPDFGSLLTWMIWLHLGYSIILVIELWAYRLGRKDIVEKMAYVSVPFGMALIAILGSFLSVAAARPLWNDLLLPVVYLISAFVIGSGVVLLQYLLFAPGRGTREYTEVAVRLGRWFFAWILFGIFTAFTISLVMTYADVPATAMILREMFTGEFAWTIWVFHVGLGIGVPIFLLLWQEQFESLRNKLIALGAASGLMVANFLMVPMNVVIPALAFRYDHVRDMLVRFDYFPHLVEWLVLLFVIGLVLVIFAIGIKLVIKPFYKATIQTPIISAEQAK
jgi:protein NrfD